jgi:hypothetical protein
MKRFRFFCLLLALPLLLAGCSPRPPVSTLPAVKLTPPAGLPVVQGKLLNQVTRIEKSMPRSGSEGFVVPTDAQKQSFAALVSDLRSGSSLEALSLASTNGYELLWYTDENDAGAVEYVLREAEPSRNGWGLYVFRVITDSPVIVEAPHPLFDQGTPQLSADIFRALDARALLVAGAHRDANQDGSADASANPQTIYQAVHAAEVEQSIQSTGAGIVLQIHGFDASKHPAYPHVIIRSQGGSDANPADLLKALQLANKFVDSLKAHSITVGLCGSDQWRDLCGSTNIQAATMRQGIFLHIEVDETIRADNSEFIQALVEAFKE